MVTSEQVPTSINGSGISPPRSERADLLKPLPAAVLWSGWLGATLLGGLAYMGIVKLLAVLVHHPSSPLTTWPGGAILAVATAILGQWVLWRLYVDRVAPLAWGLTSLLGWLCYGGLVWLAWT